MYWAGARQQAGALCPIYESSYMKICYSDARLLYMACVHIIKVGFTSVYVFKS